MKERYDELGLSCELVSPSRPPRRSALEFLCDVMGLDAPPAVDPALESTMRSA
jgi:hypothetical protein